MFSKSWGYAVRAMIRLAEIYENPQAKRLAGELAEETGMPASFLSKVLQNLSSAGLVDSVRGRNGGLRLARDPETISLYDIAKVTDDIDTGSVSLPGFEDAPEHMVDIVAKRWTPYQRGLIEFLAEIDLATLTKELKFNTEQQ